jgi:hypothetical protein
MEYSSYVTPTGALGLTDARYVRLRWWRPVTALHLTDEGKVFLNYELEDSNSLGDRLSQIYRIRQSEAKSGPRTP